MKEELERQAFENWYWNEFGQFDDGGYLDCFAVEEGDYYRLGTRMCWAAWMARAKQESKLRQTIAELRQLIERQSGYNHSALEEEQKNDS